MKYYKSRLYLILILFSLIASCSNGQNNTENMEYKHTNALINESSPYLLQTL